MRLYKIKVHSGEKRDRLESPGSDSFEVWVRAKPRRGEANAAVLALLGRHLGIPSKRLRVVRGSTSPHKIVGLLGAD